MAFKASPSPQSSTYAPVTELGLGPFTGAYATNSDWITGAAIASYYAGVAKNLFVFDVDGGGEGDGGRSSCDEDEAAEEARE